MPEQHHSLESVVGDKLVRVADYQRPYAWAEKQWRDLWDDIDLLGTDHHYAGTLVLQRTGEVETADSGQDLSVVDVVDGQQRLTTCLILLEQLRRRLADPRLSSVSRAVKAAEALGQVLVVEISGVPRPRLELAGDLSDFFVRYVLVDRSRDQDRLLESQQRLLRAADYFGGQIDALVQGAHEDLAAQRLVDLRSRVSFRLRFLVYEVDSSAEVGVLFETLNERGKPLSELEKVKNYLLYLSRQLPDARNDELAKTVNKAWSEIFTNLAGVRVDDDTLLRAHWLATKDPNPRNWQRTASIKAEYPRARYVASSVRLSASDADSSADSEVVWKDLFDDVSDYVDKLRRSSAYLKDLYTRDATYRTFDAAAATRIRRASAALVRSNSVANFLPLVLAARLTHPGDGALYARVIELCETFAARAYALCGLRSNAGQNDIARAAHDLYRGQEIELVAARLVEKLWWFASDDAVRASLQSDVSWYWKSSHKFVLYEYELALAKSTDDLNPFQHFQNTGPRKTTEHILPQTPAEGSEWWTSFTPEEHRRLCNSIGNLVLTYDNSYYSNHDYAVKRGVRGQDKPRRYFSNAALARERELADRYETWTPESIEHRRASIEAWVLDRWRVEPPEEAPVFGARDEDDEAEPAPEWARA